jgi:hypothetical protein
VSDPELLEMWEFPRDWDFPLPEVTEVLIERLTPPDLRAHLISSRGDVLTVQIAEGCRTEDADLLLYVRGRGAFEVLRREAWPERHELLVLRAWPSKS